MLLGTLGASLLRNILAGKAINKAGKGNGINRAGECVVRAGYGRCSLNSSKNKKGKKKQQNGFLMPPHPLTNLTNIL